MSLSFAVLSLVLFFLFLLFLDSVVLMVSFSVQCLDCRQSTVGVRVVLVVVVAVVVFLASSLVANLSSLVITLRSFYTGGKLW